MDNQHKKIKGYRDLSQDEIDMMNALKEIATKVGEVLDVMETVEDIDQRWLAIGKTDLQKGFMAAIRSIAKPESF
jgi:hypothetical protein